MRKTCHKCKTEKDISEFALNKAKKDGHGTSCKACNRIYCSKHYHANKQEYIDRSKIQKKNMAEFYKTLKENSCCQKCGYNKCPSALCFHHIDPKLKEFEIASCLRYCTINTLKKEIEKCIILCLNCHAELHHEERNQMRLSGVGPE